MHYIVYTCFIITSSANRVTLLYRTAVDKYKISRQLLRVKMFPAPITRHSGVQRRVNKAVLEIQLLQKSLHSDALLACWFGVRTRVCVRYFIYSTAVHAGPRAHSVLCKMDSGSDA